MPSYLERAVADVLQKVLGTFVKGIDKDSLKLSIWSGDVKLTGLELRTEVLDALPIPVKVLGASLGEVRVVVPWRNLLGKDPLIITIDQLLVVTSPGEDDDAESSEDGASGDKSEAEKAKVEREATAKRDLADATDTVEKQKEAGKQARGVAPVGKGRSSRRWKVELELCVACSGWC